MSKSATITDYLNERFGPGSVESIRLSGGRGGLHHLVVESPSPEVAEAWASFDDFCRFFEGAPPVVLEAVEDIQSVRMRG